MNFEVQLEIDAEPIPLIIVEGFLSGAGATRWGEFQRYLDASGKRRRVLFASVGPVSSLHDRACELYYAIRGGRVDYGQNHADTHGHGRYGRHIANGFYPQWSQEKPLHFLGHSMGGSTITKLQHLLHQGYFDTDDHADMILSITALSAPFRGTQAVYTLGECLDAAPSARPFSIGSLISKAIHIISYLSPILPTTTTNNNTRWQAIDLHAESRRLTYHDISFLHFLKQLWKSDWAESKDSAPYDVTFESSDAREADDEGKLHPRTFYTSHVACMTRKSHHDRSTHCPASPRLLSPFTILARSIGAFDFQLIRPAPAFLATLPEKGSTTSDMKLEPVDSESIDPQTQLSQATETSLGEEYWANDGVVPLFSQYHPHTCSPTHCSHHQYPNLKRNLTPGIWHVHRLDDAHHCTLLPQGNLSERQRQFWKDLGSQLDRIDVLIIQAGLETRIMDSIVDSISSKDWSRL